MRVPDRQEDESLTSEQPRRQIGTTRFWSKFGTALALLATLWSALIGRTIPDLLQSHKSPVVEFRDAAEHICSRLPQADSTETGVLGSPQPPLTTAAADRLGRQFDATTWLPFDAVTKQLLTLVRSCG